MDAGYRPLHLLLALFLTLVAAVGCTAAGSGNVQTAAFEGERSGDRSSTSVRSGSRVSGDLQIVDQLPPPPNTNQGADQLVAENDLLEVDVFQVDELDRQVKVDSRGQISLALIGSVEAKNKTIPELEEEIERLYGAKYLQNPEISVFMKESAGQRITVDGAVAKPGIYPVSSTSTLLQIIALAGGFTEIADESKLYVYRDFQDRKLVANFDVKQIREGKQRDPRIYGGDVIVSFDSGAKIAARNLREALGLATGAVRIAAPF